MHKLFGESDLIARNIQRGRDHGLPAYIELRKLWDTEHVSSFEDLDNISDEVISPICIMILKSVFSDI